MYIAIAIAVAIALYIYIYIESERGREIERERERDNALYIYIYTHILVYIYKSLASKGCNLQFPPDAGHTPSKDGKALGGNAGNIGSEAQSLREVEQRLMEEEKGSPEA